jgi:hypothetical protein
MAAVPGMHGGGADVEFMNELTIIPYLEADGLSFLDGDRLRSETVVGQHHFNSP